MKITNDTTNQPSLPNDHPSPGRPLFTAEVIRKSNKKPAIIVAVLGIAAMGLGVGGAAVFAPHKPSATGSVQAAATPTTETSSDLTAAMNKASNSVDQSEKDSLAADDAINDSAHQVAVPTE